MRQSNKYSQPFVKVPENTRVAVAQIPQIAPKLIVPEMTKISSISSNPKIIYPRHPMLEAKLKKYNHNLDTILNSASAQEIYILLELEPRELYRFVKNHSKSVKGKGNFFSRRRATVAPESNDVWQELPSYDAGEIANRTASNLSFSDNPNYYMEEMSDSSSDSNEGYSESSSESDEYSDAPLNDDLEEQEIDEVLFGDDSISSYDARMFGHGLSSSKNRVAPEPLPVQQESVGDTTQDVEGSRDDDIPTTEGNFEKPFEQNQALRRAEAEKNLAEYNRRQASIIKEDRHKYHRTPEEIQKDIDAIQEEWYSKFYNAPRTPEIIQQSEELLQKKKALQEELRSAENKFTVPRRNRERIIKDADEKDVKEASEEEKNLQLRLLEARTIGDLNKDDMIVDRKNLWMHLHNKKSEKSKLPVLIVEPKTIKFTRTEVVPDGYTKIDNKPLIKNKDTTLYPVDNLYNKDSMENEYQRNAVWNRYEEGKPEYTVSRTTAQRRPGETLGALFRYQTYINKRTKEEKTRRIKWEYSFKVEPDKSRNPILYTGEEWQLT